MKITVTNSAASENSNADASSDRTRERQSSNWDVRNGPKNYAWLVLLQIFSAGLSFCSVWVITRYLGSDGYGGIVAVISGSQIVQMLVNWSCVALSRYGVEEFVSEGKIRKSFWARSFVFLPNLALILALSPFWLPYVSGWVKVPNDFAWLIVGYFVTSSIWVHIQHALQGAKMPRLQSSLLVAERFLILATLVSLVISGRLTAVLAISVYVFMPIAVSLIGLFYLRSYISGKVKIDSDTLGNILKFSLPLIPFSLIGYFSSSYIDAIFIAQYLEKSDLGIYGIAYQMNGALQQFLVLGNTLLIPMFVTMKTNGEVSKMEKYIKEIVPTICLIGGFGIVVIVVIQKFSVPYLFAADAEVISSVFAVLSLSVLFSIPALIGYIPFFIAHSSSYIGTINAVIIAAVNIAGNYILIPKFGLIGSAWSTALSSLIGLFVVMFIVNQKYRLKRTWTSVALVPAFVAIGYASFSNQFALGAILSLVLTLIISAVFRKTIRMGILALILLRRELT